MLIAIIAHRSLGLSVGGNEVVRLLVQTEELIETRHANQYPLNNIDADNGEKNGGNVRNIRVAECRKKTQILGRAVKQFQSGEEVDCQGWNR